MGMRFDRVSAGTWAQLGNSIGNAYNASNAPSMQDAQKIEYVDAPANQSVGTGYDANAGTEYTTPPPKGLMEQAGVDQPQASYAGGAEAPPTRVASYSHKGVTQDAPFTDKQIADSNHKAAKAYWQDKGSFGESQVRALDAARAAERADAMGGLEMDEATRRAAQGKAQDEANKALAPLFERLSVTSPDSAEYETLVSQANRVAVGAFGADKGTQIMERHATTAEKRLARETARGEREIFRASGSEASALDYYNNRNKDPFKAFTRQVDGGTQMFRAAKDGSEEPTPIGAPYKSWESGGRRQFISAIPEIAKSAAIEERKHEFRMREGDQRQAGFTARSEAQLRSLEKRAGMTGSRSQTASDAKAEIASDKAFTSAVKPFTKIGSGADKLDVPEVDVAARSMVRFGGKTPEEAREIIAKLHSTSKSPQDYKAAVSMLQDYYSKRGGSRNQGGLAPGSGRPAEDAAPVGSLSDAPDPETMYSGEATPSPVRPATDAARVAEEDRIRRRAGLQDSLRRAGGGFSRAVGLTPPERPGSAVVGPW